MTVDGARILNALRARIQSITEANGYPLTLKDVILGEGLVRMDTPNELLPLVEIIEGDERNEGTSQGGQTKHVLTIWVRLYQPKETTNEQMQEFVSSVMRCIFADGYSEGGNGGTQFGDADGYTTLYPRWVSTEKDYNMLPLNRIYSMRFEFRNVRWTYKF